MQTEERVLKNSYGNNYEQQLNQRSNHMYSTPQRVKTAQKNGRLSTDPYGTGFSMERQRF